MSSTYFDAASAFPLHPAASQALAAALADGWADPSKLYGAARRARQLLDASREAVAAVIGARPDEVSFTANGTQAVHAAVLGGLRGRSRAGNVFVHSAIEHSAVLHAAELHERDGGRAVPVGVDRAGRVDVDAFDEAVAAPGVALAALISASHEAGTVQPVGAVAALCEEAGVPLFVDAAQSAMWPGGIEPGWSLLSLSARKWGGPPGVGVLAVRHGTRWETPWPSDANEAGRVPGAVNLPSVVASAAALRAAAAEAAELEARLRALTALVRERVPLLVPDVEVVGDPDERLPHLVTFSCLYVDGEAILSALDREGFAVSSGSSCTSSTLRPSHVLEAMGVLSHGNVRLSLHRDVAAEDVERFLEVLPPLVARLREESGVTGL
ncbi:cysteine desulfurase [Phytomonospora endophytica]|uniref:Cysteine desulfurase n=1 Tax=Phytomonospora endophytica TaxID=714109 RepID=A0A841FEU9_9ACTN|nr:aminotransferase class V-fold PLP-dependent enzyme [Phytomonospora endophytica]MBB6034796.1 cysteine desulfurase [Phytomonospora endophytica]GIG69001.1 aminotransferase [Phytomonospora endophytica]